MVNQSAQLCLLIEQYTWHIISIEWNPVSKIHGRRPSVIRNTANTECQYQLKDSPKVKTSYHCRCKRVLGR